MRNQITGYILLIVLTMLYVGNANAASYQPAKVVYDLTAADPKEINHILDRTSMLQRVYNNDSFEASIIIVIHEGAIPAFSNRNNNKQQAITHRAKSLTNGEIIQFRICQASAKMQGYSKKDFDGFIQLVPMADAEIIKLQNEGYGYLR